MSDASLIPPSIAPFVPLGLAVRTASHVVRATITGVEVGEPVSTLTLVVDEVLRGGFGVDGDGGTIRCAFGGWEPVVGMGGYFALHAGGEDDRYALLCFSADTRPVLRALAGLSPALPQPGVDELMGLVDSSHVVVRGVARSTSSTTAVLRVTRVVRDNVGREHGREPGRDVGGDARRLTPDDIIEVERGFELDEPGGAWEFGLGPIATGVGVGEYYFLKHERGRWLVMNPVEPGTLTDADVVVALGRTGQSTRA